MAKTRSSSKRKENQEPASPAKRVQKNKSVAPLASIELLNEFDDGNSLVPNDEIPIKKTPTNRGRKKKESILTNSDERVLKKKTPTPTNSDDEPDDHLDVFKSITPAQKTPVKQGHKNNKKNELANTSLIDLPNDDSNQEPIDLEDEEDCDIFSNQDNIKHSDWITYSRKEKVSSISTRDLLNDNAKNSNLITYGQKEKASTSIRDLLNDDDDYNCYLEPSLQSCKEKSLPLRKKPSLPLRKEKLHNVSLSSRNETLAQTSPALVSHNGDNFQANEPFNMIHSNNNAFTPTLPAPFRDMDTMYQLCLWLCTNPNVLQFACNMYQSMKVPVADGTFQYSTSLLATAPQTLPQEQNQVDKTRMGRDFLEELKCLFLRVRNPSKRVLEDLVQKVILCDLNSTEGIEWLRIASRNFGDFRNKLLDSIEILVKSFKEKLDGRSRLPTKEEVEKFVNENTTINILRRWLNATKMEELRRRNSIPILHRFIQKAFIINYLSRNTEDTKLLDKFTRNIAVPSRNGGNFASDLQL